MAGHLAAGPRHPLAGHVAHVLSGHTALLRPAGAVRVLLRRRLLRVPVRVVRLRQLADQRTRAERKARTQRQRRRRSTAIRQKYERIRDQDSS